jgi:hypothetical protein
LVVLQKTFVSSPTCILGSSCFTFSHNPHYLSIVNMSSHSMLPWQIALKESI